MTLTHRSALALLSSFLFVSIGLSRADAVYAQETANPLYDQLGARLAIAQDSASSTQELRTFLGGLSDTELIELARQAIDKDDRLLLKRGVSRELQSRLLAGTAIDSLLETATNSSEASEVRTFAFGTLKSARRKVTPEFRRRMFSAAAGAATTAETPGETRLTALRTANRSIGLLIEEGAAEAKAVEAYGKQLEAIIVDRQEDGALRADAVRGLGMIDRREGVPSLLSLLTDSRSSTEHPLVLRVTCNVLADFKEQSAIAPISAILATTENDLVFGSAAYSLGRLDTRQSLNSLLSAEHRFTDSGFMGVAIRQQRALIMKTLADPKSPDLAPAILATKYFYQKADIGEYRAKLLALLPRVSDPEIIRSILVRLSRVRDKGECAAILGAVPRQPAYGDAWDVIYRCSIAVPLVGKPSTVPVPVPVPVREFK